MVGMDDEEVLKNLYEWIDHVPLSRLKRNFSRDFSDGVLTAEIAMHYFPKMVDIHNYHSANGTTQKMENWHLLNRKVFSRFGFEVADDLIRQVVDCRPLAAEQVLLTLRSKIAALSTVERSSKAARPSEGTSQQQQQHTNGSGETFLPPIASATSSSSSSGGITSQLLGRNHPTISTHRGSGRSLLLGDGGQQLSLDYEETIQILQAKIRRLEHLLRLKDVHIDDLQSKLDAVQQAVGRRA